MICEEAPTVTIHNDCCLALFAGTGTGWNTRGANCKVLKVLKVSRVLIVRGDRKYGNERNCQARRCECCEVVNTVSGARRLKSGAGVKDGGAH